MTETPLPVAFDPETLDALGVAYERAGPPRHRPPPPRPRDATSWSPTSPTSGRAREYRALRPARPLATSGGSGRTGSREPSYMHSFAMTERYLVLVELPARRQPAAARPRRPAVHRELPLEAGARHPLPGLRPRQRRAGPDLRGRCLLLLPPHQRLRTRVGDRDRHGLLRRCLDRRLALPRPRPHRPADRHRARPRRFATGSHPIPTRFAAKSSATPPSSCRRSTTASATDAPIATSTGSAPTATATRRTSSTS